MKKIFKYKNGCINVMYNEKPMQKDFKEECVSKIIEHKTFVTDKTFSLGIELMINKGGRICYGMLNVSIVTNNTSDCVNISLSYTDKNTVKYKESILVDDSYVYKGVPNEYVEHIMYTVEQAIKKKETFPQYNIDFECAANCEVGSSLMIFEIITEIIMEMLYIGKIEGIFNMDIESFTKKYVNNVRLVY